MEAIFGEAEASACAPFEATRRFIYTPMPRREVQLEETREPITARRVLARAAAERPGRLDLQQQGPATRVCRPSSQRTGYERALVRAEPRGARGTTCATRDYVLGRIARKGLTGESLEGAAAALRVAGRERRAFGARRR